jgi:hypothetical protein
VELIKLGGNVGSLRTLRGTKMGKKIVMTEQMVRDHHELLASTREFLNTQLPILERGSVERMAATAEMVKAYAMLLDTLNKGEIDG